MSGWWDELVRPLQEGMRDGFRPPAPATGRGLFANPFLTERDRELAATRAAFQDAEAIWHRSPLASADVTDLAIGIVREAARSWDRAPSIPVLMRCIGAVADLLAAEEFGALEPNWRAIESDLAAGVGFRGAIRRRTRWVNEYERFRAAIVHCVTESYASLFNALPDLCFSDWEEGGTGFGVPLMDVMERPAEVIERLLLFPYDDEAIRCDVFALLKRVIVQNLLLASGLPPTADPIKHQSSIVLPTRQKGQDARQLAETYLGGTPFLDILETPIPFSIPAAARFEHCHIVGGTGHGKTQLMQHLIHDDLIAAMEEKRSVVVIDSQGDLIGKLSRLALFAPGEPLADRLIIVDPSDVEFPFSLNLFDTKQERFAGYGPADRERVLNGVVELYETFFGALLGAELTQKQGVIFRYLARLMLVIPNADIHTLMRLMEDGRPFQAHMRGLEGAAHHFFETEFFDASFTATKKQILKRLWGVLSTPAFERMFAQSDNKLDLFDAMNAGKIILISTAKDLLKTEGSQLLGRFFIAMIAQAAFERSTLPIGRRTPTFVYIDEAQEYFDDNVEIILNQARKYSVGLTIAHQTLDQLSPRLRAALLSNTSVKCAGGVSSKDARAFAPELRTSSEFIESMRRYRDRTEFAVFVKQVTPQALRLAAPLGFLERQTTMDDDAFDEVLAANRARYCGTLATSSEMREELSEPANPAPVTSVERPPAPTLAPLVTRTSPRTDLRQELGKGGPKHRYLQNLVKELAEAQGFRATIEAAFGEPSRQVDVLIEREGILAVIEVSVTTPASWERDQVASCLRAGAPRVALVRAKSKRTEGRYRDSILEGLGDHERALVTFLLPEELPEYFATLAPPPEATETLTRGYKVRVSRTSVSPEEARRRQDALSRLVAKSLASKKDT